LIEIMLATVVGDCDQKASGRRSVTEQSSAPSRVYGIERANVVL
jgi:hypothetical protein